MQHVSLGWNTLRVAVQEEEANDSAEDDKGKANGDNNGHLLVRFHTGR